MNQSPNHPIPFVPYLVLAFGILAVSMSAILVRWAGAPATVNGFYRMTIAALAMTIPSYNAIRHPPPLATRHLLTAALAGLFFGLNLAAWNTSALITSAANVSLLGNTSVIWVPLAGLVLFKERLRPAFWGGLALALVGAVVILGRDLLAHPTLGIGDSFAVLSSLFSSGYLLIMERVRAKLSTLVAWWTATIASALTLLALTLLLQQSLVGYAWTAYVIFVATALVVQIGGFLSLSYALGHLPASLVAASLLIQPVIAAFLAVPLLGQSVAVVQALGGVLVLVGILIVHQSRQ